eukprot:COSAG04_NODE_5212_length_1701_cov_1.483146_2_plen_21_part_01
MVDQIEHLVVNNAVRALDCTG